MMRSGAAASRSIRWHLGAMCGLLVLPATLFLGLLLWQYALSERARLVSEGLERAQELSHAIEQDLASLIGTARLAASSPRLQAGDIETSGASARTIGQALGVDFVIREPSGRQLLNTRMPAQENLPSRNLDIDAQVLRTRQPSVSDLFAGASSGRLSVAVVAPVVRPDREVVFLVDLVVPTERVQAILVKQPLPAGVVANILDRKGRVIARSRLHEQFAGQEAMPILQAATGREGYYEGTSLDGVPVLVYYTRVGGSDWIVAVGMERQTLNAPIWRLLGQLVALGAALAFLSALLAYLFSRRISGAFDRLSASAAALGRGEAARPVRSSIAEINRVGEVLVAASEERRRHEKRQDLMVRELHHRVKNTLATVQAVVSSSARSAASMAELQETVIDRIGALARTHTLLVNNDWDGAPLRVILDAELAPYDDPRRARVRLEGPDLRVPGDIALALGMIVHELTTNAAKYGAFSVPAGALSVTWRTEGDATRPILAIAWTESGIADCRDSGHRGFGTKLIERVVTRQLQGEVGLAYRPGGLQATITIPLSTVSANEGTRTPEGGRPGA